MRVKILARLKLGSKFINKGTIFEDTEKPFPSFVAYELKQSRGNIEILPELKEEKKKKRKKREFRSKSSGLEPSVKAKIESPSKKKSTILREKLSKAEK